MRSRYIILTDSGIEAYITEAGLIIDINELRSSSLSGFYSPNTFNIDNFINMALNYQELKSDNCNELCFAINESEIDDISDLSLGNRLYLISLLFICYRINKCWFSETLYIIFLKLTAEASDKELELLLKLINLLRCDTDNYAETFDLILKLGKLIILHEQNLPISFLSDELKKYMSSYKDIFENSDTEEQIYKLFLENFSDHKVQSSLLDILTA